MYRGPFLQEEQRLAHDLADGGVREDDLVEVLDGQFGLRFTIFTASVCSNA